MTGKANFSDDFKRDRVQSRVKELETAGAAAQNSLAALDSEVSNLASSLTAAVPGTGTESRGSLCVADRRARQ